MMQMFIQVFRLDQTLTTADNNEMLLSDAVANPSHDVNSFIIINESILKARQNCHANTLSDLSFLKFQVQYLI